MTWQQVAQNAINAATPLAWVVVLARISGRSLQWLAVWGAKSKS